MCMGLDGLHSRRIMHRGLEAENIFLTKDFDVRIGDLGAAKDTTYVNDLSSTMIGPPRVVSPQIANRKSYS
jgi:serine/threonine protein kinase